MTYTVVERVTNKFLELVKWKVADENRRLVLVVSVLEQFVQQETLIVGKRSRPDFVQNEEANDLRNFKWIFRLDAFTVVVVFNRLVVGGAQRSGQYGVPDVQDIAVFQSTNDITGKAGLAWACRADKEREAAGVLVYLGRKFTGDGKGGGAFWRGRVEGTETRLVKLCRTERKGAPARWAAKACSEVIQVRQILQILLGTLMALQVANVDRKNITFCVVDDQMGTGMTTAKRWRGNFV